MAAKATFQSLRKRGSRILPVENADRIPALLKTPDLLADTGLHAT
jgi:hypothetical protein